MESNYERVSANNRPPYTNGPINCSIGSLGQAPMHQLSQNNYDQAQNLVPNYTNLERVKKPLNVFMIWSQGQRRKMLEIYPQMHNSEISKWLGAEWRRLSDLEKGPYLQEAERLRQVHLTENLKYKYKPKRQQATYLRQVNYQPGTPRLLPESDAGRMAASAVQLSSNMIHFPSVFCQQYCGENYSRYDMNKMLLDKSLPQKYQNVGLQQAGTSHGMISSDSSGHNTEPEEDWISSSADVTLKQDLEINDMIRIYLPVGRLQSIDIPF
ncbi:transcription factor sox-3-like [Rhynchophorus ferrugineus]|uniref:transcription factor sox-3-like n=1 Tax=Rhynchophorus ferrugineus TaxID=354439 RepID=UPI003FCDEF66